MAYPIFLLITSAVFIYGVIVIWADRKHFPFMYPSYWIFLITPWKITTFVLGAVAVNLLVYLSIRSIGITLIDSYLTTTICALTYVFAPWYVGFAYRYFKRGLYKDKDFLNTKYSWKSIRPLSSPERKIYDPNNQFFGAIAIWLFVTLIIHHFYTIVVYGLANFARYLPGQEYELILQMFVSKSFFFVLAGLIWNLEYRAGRGLTISLRDRSD